MGTMIARPESGRERIFPQIGPDLYQPAATVETLTPDQRAAQRALALADCRFASLSALRSLRVEPRRRLGWILQHHRLGLAAELNGAYHRADFFWREVQSQLGALSPQKEVWQAVADEIASEPGVVILSDPVQLRQRLIDEVVIDTYCALYNGYAQTECPPTLESRAFAHIDRIRTTLELGAPTDADIDALLAVPLKTRIALDAQALRWNAAFQEQSYLLKRFPNRVEYQEQLVGLHFSRTVTGFRNGKDQSDYYYNANTLSAGIGRVKQLRQAYPTLLAVFEALSLLYHLYAIMVANQDQLANALLAIEKSVTYNPLNEDARQTRRELIKRMQQLQADVKGLAAELARNPDLRLNTQGIKMRAEAKLGFSLSDAFVNSDEARAIRAEYQVARACYLLVPSDSRRFRHRVEQQHAGQEPQPARPEAHSAPDNPPLLKGVAEPARDAQPVGYWLLSRQHLLVKGLAVAAILLVLLTGALTYIETAHRGARDASYQQIVGAVEHQDDVALLNNAETFLANRPWYGDAARTEEVRALYSQAIVRWIAAQRAPLTPAALERVEQYRMLAMGK